MKRIGCIIIVAVVSAVLLTGCKAVKPSVAEEVAPAPQDIATAVNLPETTVQEEVLVQTPSEPVPVQTEPAAVPVPEATPAPAKTETTKPVQLEPVQEAVTPQPIPTEQPAPAPAPTVTETPPVTQTPAVTDTAGSVDAVSSATERGNYKNGLFSLQSPPNSEGYYLLAMMRVENGNIISLSLQLYDKAGKLVDNAYAEGLGARAEEMKENLAALDTYAIAVIDAQNSSDVSEKPGTAWSYEIFLSVVPELLRQGR